MSDEAKGVGAARVTLGPDNRLGRVAVWFAGLAILEAGQIAVRLLVGSMPSHLHFRDPPFWPSIACYGFGTVGYIVLWRELRLGRTWAKALASLAIVAALVGTYLSLNTVTIHPGPDTVPALNSLAESWRGVGWPGMFSHPEEFVATPSGAWHVSDVLAAAFAMLVGFTALWFLATGRMRAPSERRTGPAAIERIAGFSLAIHLSFHAILTIAALVGLSSRIAGRL